jgi:hypothetical protein
MNTVRQLLALAVASMLATAGWLALTIVAPLALVA